MNRFIIQVEATLLLASIVITSTACNSTGTPANTATNSASANAVNTAAPVNATTAERFSEDELDELFARIALYPDPLIAQIIPASTFVEQLSEAQGTLKGSADDALIDNQNWDVSVKSVAHYPQVLKMMTDDQDWTTSVGQAYVMQPDDVGNSIQRLRADAMDVGNLVTTPQQEIVENGEVINIYPAQEKTIYVPQYNAETVYTEPAPESNDGISTGAAIATAAIAFGAGLLIGSWLNNDYDYDDQGIYYHGWNTGPAWVNVNRAYVNVNHAAYVNHNYSTLHVNRNVVTHHSATTYRRNLTLNSSLRRGRVDNARINNINRAPNGRLRTNAGRHLGNDKVNNLDRNRVNNGRNPNHGGNPNLGGNRGGSPKINTNDRNLGGRNNAAPKVQNRQAPAQRQRPAAPNRGGSGGRRRP
jgi:hypothetical protein